MSVFSRKITVKRHDYKKRTEITICNDGIPIPDDQRLRIFKSRHTTKEGHFGLGLGVVKRLVDFHGWKITLENNEQTTYNMDYL